MTYTNRNVVIRFQICIFDILNTAKSYVFTNTAML